VSTIDLGAREVRRLLPIQPSADVATLVSTARAQRRNVLFEPEAKAFLQAHGIPVPPGRVVRTADEAPAAVDAIGPPVVVKAVAHQLLHKTEAGAVIFPVDSPAGAQAACRTIAARLAAYRQDIVVDVLRALSDLSQQPAVAREMSEIEINPLAVTENGALALDALIVLRS
jgi:acyl-CoA synthetase (NDP forming)